MNIVDDILNIGFDIRWRKLSNLESWTTGVTFPRTGVLLSLVNGRCKAVGSVYDGRTGRNGLWDSQVAVCPESSDALDWTLRLCPGGPDVSWDDLGMAKSAVEAVLTGAELRGVMWQFSTWGKTGAWNIAGPEMGRQLSDIRKAWSHLAVL